MSLWDEFKETLKNIGGLQSAATLDLATGMVAQKAASAGMQPQAATQAAQSARQQAGIKSAGETLDQATTTLDKYVYSPTYQALSFATLLGNPDTYVDRNDEYTNAIARAWDARKDISFGQAFADNVAIGASAMPDWGALAELNNVNIDIYNKEQRDKVYMRYYDEAGYRVDPAGNRIQSASWAENVFRGISFAADSTKQIVFDPLVGIGKASKAARLKYLDNFRPESIMKTPEWNKYQAEYGANDIKVRESKLALIDVAPEYKRAKEVLDQIVAGGVSDDAIRAEVNYIRDVNGKPLLDETRDIQDFVNDYTKYVASLEKESMDHVKIIDEASVAPKPTLATGVSDFVEQIVNRQMTWQEIAEHRTLKEYAVDTPFLAKALAMAAKRGEGAVTDVLLVATAADPAAYFRLRDQHQSVIRLIDNAQSRIDDIEIAIQRSLAPGDEDVLARLQWKKKMLSEEIVDMRNEDEYLDLLVRNDNSLLGSLPGLPVSNAGKVSPIIEKFRADKAIVRAGLRDGSIKPVVNTLRAKTGRGTKSASDVEFDWTRVQSSPLMKPVYVAQWIGHRVGLEKPSGLVTVDGLDYYDGVAELRAFLDNTPVFDGSVELKNELLDKFVSQRNSLGRKKVLEEVDRAVVKKTAEKYGFDKQIENENGDLVYAWEAIYSKFLQERALAVEAFKKDKVFGVDSNQTLLANPVLESQLDYAAPMIDADAFDKFMKDHAEDLTTAGVLAANIRQIKGEWIMPSWAMVDRFWRFDVLARGGYVQRSVGGELTTLAMYDTGLNGMFGVGTISEATKNFFSNRWAYLDDYRKRFQAANDMLNDPQIDRSRKDKIKEIARMFTPAQVPWGEYEQYVVARIKLFQEQIDGAVKAAQELMDNADLFYDQYKSANGKILYHGSPVELNIGDIVKPGRDFSYAYSTSDPTLAKEYGPNIYVVKPVNEVDAADSTTKMFEGWVGEPSADNKSVTVAREGFVIVDRMKNYQSIIDEAQAFIDNEYKKLERVGEQARKKGERFGKGKSIAKVSVRVGPYEFAGVYEGPQGLAAQKLISSAGRMSFDSSPIAMVMKEMGVTGSGTYAAITPTDDAYFTTLAGIVNQQFRGSRTASAVLAGKSDDEILEYLRSPMGQDELKKLNWIVDRTPTPSEAPKKRLAGQTEFDVLTEKGKRRNEIIRLLEGKIQDEGAEENYLQFVKDEILNLYLPNQAMRDLVRERLASDELGRGYDMVTSADLRIAARGADLRPIHGEVLESASIWRNKKLTPAEKLNTWFNDVIYRNVFRWIGEVPEDALIATPFANATYNTKLAEIVETWLANNITELSTTDVLQAQTIARKWAVKQSREYLYRVVRKNSIGDAIPLLSPFFQAQYSTFKRTGKLTYRNPDKAARVVWAFNQLQTNSYEDENGQRWLIWNIPNDWTDEKGLSSRVPDHWRYALISQGSLRFNVQSFNFIMAGLRVATPELLPGEEASSAKKIAAWATTAQSILGTGPVVQMAANQIIKNNPALDQHLTDKYGVAIPARDIIEIFASPYPADEWYAPFMSAWNRRVATLINGEGNNDFERTQLVMFQNHKDRIRMGEEQPLSDDPLKNDDMLMELSAKEAGAFTALRLVVNLTSGFIPTYEGPMSGYVEQYRKYQDKWGSEAFKKWLEDYPDMGYIAVSRSKNLTGSSATPDAVFIEQKYKDTIEKAIDDTGLAREEALTFVQMVTNKDIGIETLRDPQAAYWQRKQGDRLRLTAEEGYAKQQERQGWADFFTISEEFNNKLKEKRISPYSAAAAQDVKEKKRKIDLLRQTNPEWYQKYTAGTGSSATTAFIRAMKVVLADEEYMNSLDKNSYWHDFEKILEQRDKLIEGARKAGANRPNAFNLDKYWKNIQPYLQNETSRYYFDMFLDTDEFVIEQ